MLNHGDRAMQFFLFNMAIAVGILWWWYPVRPVALAFLSVALLSFGYAVVCDLYGDYQITHSDYVYPTWLLLGLAIVFTFLKR